MNKHLLSKTLVSFIFACLYLISAKDAKACTGMDLVITKITFTYISSSDYTYTYEIKNNGTVAVPLNQITLQNYVATDAQGSNKYPAAGYGISQSPTEEIAAGATYTGTLSANPNVSVPHPQSSYPYLAVVVSIYPGTECDNTNNAFVALIELTTTGVQSKHVADATLIWNTTAKSFSVSNWSGTNGNTLDYSIVSTSGSLVASGKTSEGESVPLQPLQGGMYIIYLSDGISVYSKKIFY